MIIEITGRHLEVSDQVKTYIAKKLEHFAKYTSRILEARMIIESTRGLFKVEVVVTADHSKYYGDSDDPDMRGAIDKAIKKMDAQLRTHKEKMQDRHRKAKRFPVPPEEIAEEIDEIIDEDYLE